MPATGLKAMARERTVKVGHFIVEFVTPGIGHLLKNAGCDFVLFDTEHSGFHNETIKSAFDKAIAGEDSNGREVTYKLLKGDTYVVSGRQNGKIFYEKTMLKGDVFKTFTIEYDESERDKYDPITARISRSFVSLGAGVG